MKYFYSWLALSLLTSITSGSIAVAEGSKQPRSDNTYDPEFVQSYTQECMQTSMGEGLEETEAKKLCGCTIDEFQRQYSQTEFTQLTAASATDEKAETKLIKVGQFCFEKILYAE